MARKIEIDVDEVRRVFLLLEQVNGMFHQSFKYKNTDIVSEFAESSYPEIKELYYQVVWHWLPKDIQDEMEER